MALQVTVVSAETQVWSGEATSVVARTTEGEIGILPQHEPVLATLGEGTVRISANDGSKIEVDAADGFLSVEHDRVSIIARRAAIK